MIVPLLVAAAASQMATQRPVIAAPKPATRPMVTRVMPLKTVPAANATAAQEIANLQKLKGSEREGPAVLVTRPGKMMATAIRARVTASAAAVKRKPKLIASMMVTMKMPGVASVNGAKSGTFEPGAGYEILGSGFGVSTGSVLLRHGGRIINLGISHWSDSQILATMPDDGSTTGLPDADRIELDVGPAGKPVFKSNAYGFRAARADQTLTITDAMFSYDPGNTTMFGVSLPTNMAPTTKRFRDDYYWVERQTQDGLDKKCINLGFDRISWANVPLHPGFEVTGYLWYHTVQKATQEGRTSGTPRGDYKLTWEGNAVRVDYGVIRYYTEPFLGFDRRGECTSKYRVKLIVTGPKGLPAQ